MSLFAKRMEVSAEETPLDPNDPLVDHLNFAYPFRNEAFGVKSMIRLVVWTVFEMKKRGLI